MPVLGGADLCPHTCSPRTRLGPRGPSVGTHTSALTSSSRASSPRRPLLPVLASWDKGPRERCPCVYPFDQLENAFGTVWLRKEQREFLVKPSAWHRIWFLLRHRVFTQPHTVRLKEVGLCALLHKHGRPQVIERSCKAVLHSEGTVWFLQSKNQIHFLELNRKLYGFLGGNLPPKLNVGILQKLSKSSINCKVNAHSQGH